MLDASKHARAEVYRVTAVPTAAEIGDTLVCRDGVIILET